MLRCRGYSTRPGTLFFPFCSVVLPNQKEVHNIGEYVSYLNSSDNFDLLKRLGLCLGMCDGLGYLHDNKFLHKFLSHKNVMVNGPVDNVVVMLADFGEFNSPEACKFEQLYNAPELVSSNDFTEASDVYSIGRLCENVLSGDFNNSYDIYSYLGLYDGNSRLNSVCNLLDKMYHMSPVKRPNMKDVQLKFLQIIEVEDEQELNNFIPADVDNTNEFVLHEVEDVIEETVDPVFNDGTDEVEDVIEGTVDPVFDDANECETNLVDKKVARTKHRCEICGILTVRLSRHMSQSHNWSRESSSAVIALTGQRKTSTANIKSRDYHRKRWCPVESCKFVSSRIDKHLKNKHKELDDDQRARMLKLAKQFTLPLDFDKSPVKVMSVSRGVLEDNIIKELQTVNKNPQNPLKSSIDLPSDLQVPATSGHESPKAIWESSDADISFNVSLRSSNVAYERKVIVHDNNKLMYPPICADSPGTSKDPDYVPNLVELSEQRQIEVVCTDELELLLYNFGLYLKSLDGGNKGVEHIKQIVHDVKRVFQALEMKKLEDLFIKNNFRSNYLEGYCVEKKYRTLTIRKYLGDMSSFLSFLVIDELESISVASDEILKLKLKISNWTKTYKKAVVEEDWKRKLSEADNLVDETHLQQYEESKSAILAKELLEEFQGNHREVNRTEYCAIRDHLIACIHFGNGHRSGVSAYMTRKEVLTATQSTADEMLILVHKHKRSQDGPAPIVCPINSMRGY